MLQLMQKRRSSAPEAEIRSKNGASPKSLMSRGNLIVVVIALFSMFPMLSCSSGTSAVNSPIVGVWEKENANKYESNTFVFFDNGTYANTGGSGGRYSIYDNVLMLVSVGYQGSESQEIYTFTVSGNTLTLSSGGNSSGTYIKSKLSFE